MRISAVWLSSGVRLSCWCTVSTQLKIYVKLLSPTGSPITLVFWSPRLYPIPKLEPLQWGVKYTVVGKFAIFDRNRRLSRKRYEIGPWLLLNAYRKSYALSNADISMTFTDPYPGFQGHCIFMSNISKNIFLIPGLRTSYYWRVSNGTIFNDLKWPLTLNSRSLFF